MPGILRTVPVTDEQRRAHDRHRPGVVVAVLALLGAYLYLFSDLTLVAGIPTPGQIVSKVGIELPHVFDDDGTVESNIRISLVRNFSSDRERLILGLVLMGAFLSAYFLPLAWKHRSLVAWTVFAIGLFYGVPALAGLLAAHLVVYLCLHPPPGRWPWLALAPGGLAAISLAADAPGPGWLVAQTVGGAAAGAALYLGVARPMLARPRLANWLQTAVVQSALISVGVATLFEATTGDRWWAPLGVLLFFWQWLRVIFYHLDYKDGLIPDHVPLTGYLAVFLSPGVLPVWQWGIALGQGYHYVHDNFLCRDKNEIVWSGVRLLCVALVYLLIFDQARWMLVGLFESLGVPVHEGVTRNMVKHFAKGGEVGTLSVLMTTLVDMLRWILLWGGVFHFKAGIWRICGHDVDPVFNRPWAATNLVAFWPRITFHYREFLVRAFYYPVFFRWFKKQPALRILTATLAAAGFGNLVWGHITEHMYYAGMTSDVLLWELGSWPYFLLLGGGIGVTELWLRSRRHRRKPWTGGPRIVFDVLAAWATLQFFTMIRIFRRPVEGTDLWDLTRLFLRGLGISL